jgi:hypothetical protein
VWIGGQMRRQGVLAWFPSAVGGGLHGGGHQNRSSGIEHAFATAGMYRLHRKDRSRRSWEATGASSRVCSALPPIRTKRRANPGACGSGSWSTLDPLNLPVRLAPRLLKLMLSSLLRRIVLRKPKRVGWLDQLNDEAVGAVEAAAGEVGTFGHLGGLLDRYAPPLRASRTGISGCRTAQPVSDRSDG